MISDLHTLNSANTSEALAGFIACCGAKRWAAAMVASRPFQSLEALFTAANDHWAACHDADFLEAFAAHPRIGSTKAHAPQSATASAWSRQEQSGAQSASESTQEALARNNEDYYDRFGFIFIVCATGRSAEDMLALLRERLCNDRDTEIANAAEEQRKITRIRLEKWLTGRTP